MSANPTRGTEVAMVATGTETKRGRKLRRRKLASNLLPVALTALLVLQGFPAATLAWGDEGSQPADSAAELVNGADDSDSEGLVQADEPLATDSDQPDAARAETEADDSVEEADLAEGEAGLDAEEADPAEGEANLADQAEDPQQDASADDEGTASDEENGTHLTVTVGGEDVNEKTPASKYANRTIDMTIVARMPQSNGSKSITVNIPTGWAIVGYSALDTDPDESINFTNTSNPFREAVVVGEHIRIDNEYKDAISSVQLQPDTGDTAYGRVVSINEAHPWRSQYLEDYYTKSKAYSQTLGGKLTYTLTQNAANVKLVVRLRPTPNLFPRTFSSEVLPDVTVTLNSLGVVRESILKGFTATYMGTPVINRVDNENMNITVSDESSDSGSFAIAGTFSQFTASTGQTTSVSLADEMTLTLEYPKGVYFDELKKPTLTGLSYTVNEDTVNGGGTITMTATNFVLTHAMGSPFFRFYFRARTGEGLDFHPEGSTTYKNREVADFKLTGSITRCGEEKPLNQVTYKRTFFIGGSDDGYLITISNKPSERRDIDTDFGVDDHDITLTHARLNCGLAYNNVTFHLDNVDDALGMTGFRMPGRNMRNIVVHTTAGRTIEIKGPLEGSTSWTTQYGSHPLTGTVLGLADGEYISDAYVTVDLQQMDYGNDYVWTRGISAVGRFINGVGGKVAISVVKQNEEGEYVSCINPETEKEIAGSMTVKVGLDRVGAGSVSTYAMTGRDTLKHSDTWYPNDVIYFRSNYAAGFPMYSQTTIVDPVITISLPEGIELNTSSVEGYSKAGNHGAAWFPLKQVGTRQITTTSGEVWNCYDFTSPSDRDLVAHEKTTNVDTVGNDSDQNHRLYVRFDAVVSTTCPQYSISTQQIVLWWLGGDKTANATQGTSYKYIDSLNRTGRGEKTEVAAGSNPLLIKPLVGLGLDLAIRPVEDNDAAWQTYNGGAASIATVHEGRDAEVKLSYISKSESEDFNDTDIYLPIPKQGQSLSYLNNINLDDPVNKQTMSEDEFTLSLTGPVSMVADDGKTNWTTYYATSASSNSVVYDSVDQENKDSWEPVTDVTWLTADQVNDWSQVVLLKFHATDPIKPGAGGNALMTLTVDNAAELGQYDYWRAYGKAKLGTAANNWKFTPVIAATPTSATFLGQVFVDENLDAYFDQTDGSDDSAYTGGNVTAVLSKDDLTLGSVNVAVDENGQMTITDSAGNPVYLRKGAYTLTITKDAAEMTYGFDSVESATASSADGWYNDLKGVEPSDSVATISFEVTKSGEIVNGTFVPEVYYAGVGLANPTEVSVTKVWEDADNQDGIRPESVTINLLADGTTVASTELNAENDWSDTFTNLPSTSQGEAIVYTISEDKVEGYTPVITGSAADGFVVTNTHTPATVIISGEKIWNDEDFADVEGYTRPESVTVQVFGELHEEDGTTTTIYEGDAKTVTSADNWAYTWDNLPEYRNGQKISYRVIELAIPTGFDATYPEGTYNVVNTPLEGEEVIDPVTLTVKKTDAATGDLLAGVLFAAYKDDEQVATSATTDEDGVLELTFTEAGTYTLKEEVAPENYVKSEATWTVVVERSGIDRVSYNDSNEGVWTSFLHLVFGESAAEGFDAETSTLTVTNERAMGWLTITKTLDRIQAGERPAFVFEVEGKIDGEVVYSNVATIHHTGVGAESVTLANIPAGAEVTVTEVYSGSSYQAVGSNVSAATITGGQEASVSFENDYDGSARTGNGIQNHYVHADGAWSPTQQTTNVSEAAAQTAQGEE